MASPEKSLNTAVRSAKQEITETGKFLGSLLADHGSTIHGLAQTHLNQYLSEGPSTRRPGNTVMPTDRTRAQIRTTLLHQTQGVDRG
jgi:hypothetical protein